MTTTLVAAALGAILAPRLCIPRMSADPLDSDAARKKNVEV